MIYIMIFTYKIDNRFIYNRLYVFLSHSSLLYMCPNYVARPFHV